MTIKKILPWIVAVFWIALIFYLSHQSRIVSNELSTGITAVIIQAIEKIIPGAGFDFSRVNHLVRKSAHFLAYLILGILVLNALRGSGALGYIDYKRVMLALFICILFAISDEVHQLFVPGRGGQLKDVILDSTGAAIGVYVFRCFSQKGTGGR